MFREQVKKALRPVIRPLLHELEGRLRQQVENSLTSIHHELESIHQEIAALRSEIWHSKAVRLDNEVLAGCRHLDLLYLVKVNDTLLGPKFILDGECEPDTTAFLMRTVVPTSVCLDVGANFGYFTCLMAKLAWQGRTIAFEADPEMCALVRRNILVNWCERAAEAFNFAVGQVEGKMTLFRRVGRSGNTSIIQLTPEELRPFDEPPSEEFTVDCVPLDRYAPELPRVDVVKIDVEGAESLVLAGMGELIRTHQPVIVSEWSPGQTERAGFDLKELVATIDGFGLVPHIIRPGGDLEAISTGELVDLPYQNIVLKHQH